MILDFLYATNKNGLKSEFNLTEAELNVLYCSSKINVQWTLSAAKAINSPPSFFVRQLRRERRNKGDRDRRQTRATTEEFPANTLKSR